MIGMDANVLVAFTIGEHLMHQPVRDRIFRFLEDGRKFAITSGILAEFLHVVTDARRLAKPMETREALDWATFWSESEDVILLGESIEANRRWQYWLRQHHLGRKRLLDTLFAATLLEAGISDLFTLHPKDFRVFDGFTLHTIDG